MISCLLWSALHDRHIGERWSERSPNWSAVASYYSMVHALRLVWFVLYGSYPKGHSQMAKALQGTAATQADWDGISPSSCAISRAALEGAIRDGLGEAGLASRLPSVGNIFIAAVQLRNDSNYESLIQAHQYFHGQPPQEQEQPSTEFVNVETEFGRATTEMASANLAVLKFASEVLLAAFRPDSEWFCPVSEYQADDLLRLVIAYVKDKVELCYEAWCEPPEQRSNWADNLGPLAENLRLASFAKVEKASTLRQHANFHRFQVKSKIMKTFKTKVDTLSEALQHID